MAKTTGKQDGSILDLPSTSLAKVEAVEGSAKWMKEIAKEHGDTDPQKLEKRRVRLGAFVGLMERSLERLKMRQKLFLVEAKKRENELQDSLGKAEGSGEEYVKIQHSMASFKLMQQQQLDQFEVMIDQKITHLAMVDGICLTVDCVSIRDDVTSKGGKKGRVRWTQALYTMDASDEAHRLYNRSRKLYDLVEQVAAKLGITAPSIVDPDDEGSDTQEFEDEDVVDEQDKKAIRKEVDGDEF